MNKSLNNSLAHTKWECKYHIVFAPKYHRKIIFRQMRKILSKFYKKIGRDNRGESCSDHIHMLARIPPTYSVSEII